MRIQEAEGIWKSISLVESSYNWQVVKDLVAYGRELEKQYDKHFRFTLTTNGVLLNDEVQELLTKRWTTL